MFHNLMLLQRTLNPCRASLPQEVGMYASVLDRLEGKGDEDA